MTHQVGREFFATKKPWSKRKDLILGYYLTPYLAKIATRRRPILLVDAFAGPGAFDDGEPGSPEIICSAARRAAANNSQATVEVLLIEADGKLHQSLRNRMSCYHFATTHHATFLSCLPLIEQKALTYSTFLYIDPFTVEGLEWSAIDSVLSYVQRKRSVELLLNFNAVSFVRRGLAALSLPPPPIDLVVEDMSECEGSGDNPVADRLDLIVGGSWWRDILAQDDAFEHKVARITARFCDQLRTRFNEVCTYKVLANYKNRVPKYILIFGSRHKDALELMNDAMIKARNQFASESRPKESTLFEMLPVTLVPELGQARGLVLDVLRGRMRRGDVVIGCIRQSFCEFSSSELRKQVAELIQCGLVASATGKSRINDDVEVWKLPTK